MKKKYDLPLLRMPWSAYYTFHPLYKNEETTAFLTDEMMSSGHTVFQLFQMPENELDHSKWMLDVVDPEQTRKRVLSLGCGVAGMEAHWHIARPELSFELVNISQAQLDRCLCQGKRVRANAETYHSPNGPFDIVVLAYLLGHVNADMTLLSALGNLAPNGHLLIYDVFDASKHFCETLFYNPPSLQTIEIFGTANGLRFRSASEGDIPLNGYFRKCVPWAWNECTPALFVFKKPGPNFANEMALHRARKNLWVSG